MNSIRFGILAEDDTDCDVLDVLIRRMLPGMEVGIRRRRAEGCAHLRRKAPMWMKELASDGCGWLVLLHDLDREPSTNTLRNESELRNALDALEAPLNARRLICIPIEELEAWFWADQAVIDRVGRGKGKAVAEPHRVQQPKEALIRLSRVHGRRPLYSTNDNKRLAEQLDLDVCAKRCKAFAELRAFVLQAASVGSADMRSRRSRGRESAKSSRSPKRARRK